jgi:hypothetical protein
MDRLAGALYDRRSDAVEGMSLVRESVRDRMHLS